MSGLYEWFWDHAGPVIATLTLALVGGVVFYCLRNEVHPVARAATSNNGARIDILFTDQDGYTVKGFRDGGQYHYYVTPGPARVETTRTHVVGKTVIVQHDEVATAP